MAAISVPSYICCMVMDCLAEVSHVMTHHLAAEAELLRSPIPK